MSKMAYNPESQTHPCEFVRDLLPNTYFIESGTGRGNYHWIRCRSNDGLPERLPKRWETFLTSLKEYFGDYFMEVYHNTCADHKDFVIYYKIFL